MCGVKTNVVTSVEITGRYANDSLQFRPLVTTTAKNFRMRDVEADKAYSSKGNLELVAKKGGMPYIPFKTNTTVMVRGLFCEGSYGISINTTVKSS